MNRKDPGRELAAPASSAVKALLRALPWILVLGVLGGVMVPLAVTGGGFDLDLLVRLDPQLLCLSVGLALFPWLMDTLRLKVWTDRIHGPLPTLRALRVVLGTELASAVTPTAVGGLAAKVLLLQREGIPAVRGISLASLKSIEDLLFFSVAIPLAFVVSRDVVALGIGEAWKAVEARFSAVDLGGLGPLPLIALAGVGLGLVGLWVAVKTKLVSSPLVKGRRALRRLARPVTKLGREMRAVAALVGREGKTPFLVSMACTSFQWASRYSALTAFVAAMGIPVDIVGFWLLQWVVFTLMTLVPTPGASGGAEGAFILVYGALLPAGALGWLTLGWRALTYYAPVGLGAVLVGWLHVRLSRSGPKGAAARDALPR